MYLSLKMASNYTQVGTASAFVKETASVKWVLDNFTNLTGFTCISPSFSPPNNSKLTFRLGIWLNPKHFTHNVFIYLFPNVNGEKLNLEYEVSILDSQDKKCYTRIFQCYFDKKYDYHSLFSSLICRARLTEDASRFIPGNKLNLFCEVKILKDRTSSENICGVTFDNKINQNYGSLLESGKFSDIVLVVGKKNFKAHKAILSAQSAVFAAMFDHNETKEVQEGRVEIVDIFAEVLEVLLRYIYTGEIVHMKEYAEELFVAADKYQLGSLKSLCEQSLLSSLTPESVVQVFLLADMHNSAQLKANEYITKNSAQVMKPGAWKVLNQSRPELLMELYQDLAAKSKLFFKP